MTEEEQLIEAMVAAVAASILEEERGQPKPNTIRYRWPHGDGWFPLNRGGRIPRRLKKRLVWMMAHTNWGSLRMDP